MLVYDITNTKSFDNLENWLRRIQEHGKANVEKMILGNKCDLEEKRMISKVTKENLGLVKAQSTKDQMILAIYGVHNPPKKQRKSHYPQHLLFRRNSG